ncbi:hypothetical protein GCM10009834_35490 [Streptomonospora arabica]
MVRMFTHWSRLPHEEPGAAVPADTPAEAIRSVGDAFASRPPPDRPGPTPRCFYRVVERLAARADAARGPGAVGGRGGDVHS